MLSLGIAYEFILRVREVIGGGLFAERKAHKVSEPLEFAVRYERFDDDGLADDLGSWSVDTRYGFGARYTFHEEGVFAAYLSGEYRMTDYRVHSDVKASMDDKNDEVIIRLGITF